MSLGDWLLPFLCLFFLKFFVALNSHLSLLMNGVLLETMPGLESATLGPGARLLRGFATRDVPALWRALQPILAQAPLRHMITPSGHRMSVAMTNCGALGWVSDRAGHPLLGDQRLNLTFRQAR
ncbi:MAG: hypothetical protein H6973_04355 [Gammaproteobacteria bacterium]|nr:hypothetical protein [Gammaproteobacteria bacterium]